MSCKSLAIEWSASHCRALPERLNALLQAVEHIQRGDCEMTLYTAPGEIKLRADLCGFSAEEVVHRARSLTLHRGTHVRVQVECDADSGVAKHLGNDLRVHAATEQKGCGRVA